MAFVVAVSRSRPSTSAKAVAMDPMDSANCCISERIVSCSDLPPNQSPNTVAWVLTFTPSRSTKKSTISFADVIASEVAESSPASLHPLRFSATLPIVSPNSFVSERIVSCFESPLNQSPNTVAFVFMSTSESEVKKPEIFVAESIAVVVAPDRS